MIEKLNVIQAMMALLGVSAVAITALEGVMIGRRTDRASGCQPCDWSAFWVTVRINLWRVLVEAIPMAGWRGCSTRLRRTGCTNAANVEYLDCNDGGTIMLFDRLFGTYVEEKDGVPIRYGLVKS